MAGRPRRALRPHEDPAKLALRRLRDLTRYYEQDPKLRWARAAFNQARVRALAATVAFSITLQDVLAAAGDRCPALDIPLSYARGRGVMRADSATVDRLIPAVGYVPGNIAVISARANSCKGHCSPEEIAMVSRWAGRMLREGEIAVIT